MFTCLSNGNNIANKSNFKKKTSHFLRKQLKYLNFNEILENDDFYKCLQRMFDTPLLVFFLMFVFSLSCFFVLYKCLMLKIQAGVNTTLRIVIKFYQIFTDFQILAEYLLQVYLCSVKHRLSTASWNRLRAQNNKTHHVIVVVIEKPVRNESNLEQGRTQENALRLKPSKICLLYKKKISRIFSLNLFL